MTARELKQYAAEYFDKEDNPVLWRYVFKEHELQAFCEQLCREQRQLVANEVKTWTEDISIPNQYKINDICMNTDMPDLT